MRVDVIEGEATFETNLSNNSVISIPVPRRGFIKAINLQIESGTLVFPIRVITSRFGAGNTIRIQSAGSNTTLATNTPDTYTTDQAALVKSTVLYLTNDNATASATELRYFTDSLGAAYSCDLDEYQRSTYLYIVTDTASVAKVNYRMYIAVDREVTV